MGIFHYCTPQAFCVNHTTVFYLFALIDNEMGNEWFFIKISGNRSKRLKYFVFWYRFVAWISRYLIAVKFIKYTKLFYNFRTNDIYFIFKHFPLDIMSLDFINFVTYSFQIYIVLKRLECSNNSILLLSYRATKEKGNHQKFTRAEFFRPGPDTVCTETLLTRLGIKEKS